MPDFVDWFEVASSDFSSASTGGAVETVTLGLTHVGETDGVLDETEAPVWSHYGFSYRPGEASEAGIKCEAIACTIGGRRTVIGTRDLRGADVHGAMNKGDVCLWSVGKNMLRLNASGGASLLFRGEESDASYAIEPDGALVMSNQFGSISLDENGFKVALADGSTMELNTAAFQVLASAGFIRTGTVILGASAARPLTFLPASGVAEPAPNVFVLAMATRCRIPAIPFPGVPSIQLPPALPALPFPRFPSFGFKIPTFAFSFSLAIQIPPALPGLPIPRFPTFGFKIPGFSLSFSLAIQLPPALPALPFPRLPSCPLDLL